MTTIISRRIPSYLLIVVTLFLLTGSTPAPEKYTSIETLIKEGLITTEIKGKGGHSGNCINFRIKNISGKTINLDIEAGRRLFSKNESLQDILIVKNKKVKIAPGNETDIAGYGFCCQSSNGGPSSGSIFSVGEMAPENWVELAQLIDKNDFPVDKIQSAVWVLSNDHPLSSVGRFGMEDVQPLLEKLATIKNIEIPWYTVKYKDDTSTVFSDQVETLQCEIEYFVRDHAGITINVRDESGRVYSTLIKGTHFQRGYHTYPIKLNVLGWKKGKYTISVYQNDNQAIYKRSFSI